MRQDGDRPTESCRGFGGLVPIYLSCWTGSSVQDWGILCRQCVGQVRNRKLEINFSYTVVPCHASSQCTLSVAITPLLVLSCAALLHGDVITSTHALRALVLFTLQDHSDGTATLGVLQGVC